MPPALNPGVTRRASLRSAPPYDSPGYTGFIDFTREGLGDNPSEHRPREPSECFKSLTAVPAPDADTAPPPMPAARQTASSNRRRRSVIKLRGSPPRAKKPGVP